MPAKLRWVVVVMLMIFRFLVGVLTAAPCRDASLPAVEDSFGPLLERD
ncbi:hypothetical protein ACFPRL_18525 [Pseudoclavibacter helvolus]